MPSATITLSRVDLCDRAECARPFMRVSPLQAYCSPSCRGIAQRERVRVGTVGGTSERLCLQCGEVFALTNHTQTICSDGCRSARRKDQNAERGMSPGQVLTMRGRCSAWARTHRRVTRTNAWLAGAPPYESHLQGGAMTIALDPHPHWPIELRNTRALHGALTSILDKSHLHRFPLWSLIPWQSGWAVFWHVEDGAALANREIERPLFDMPTRFRFGPLVRFRAPSIVRRGRMRVRLDTVTPVVLRNNGGVSACMCPEASHVRGALVGDFLHRLMPSQAWADYVAPRVCVDLVTRETEPAHVPLLGKYGMVSGWQGHVVIEVNAVSRWLLGVAERMGLGGRTAFGFGRIRITDIAC